ncbi:MAG: TonB-dependent receptor [Bacteroidales bacterium]|nr:TonB-dependent receptor [Bacteroidales bacterium]
MFGISYKAEDFYYEKGIKGRYKLNGANDNALNTEHYYDDTQGTSQVLWGALLNLSFKISDHHKLALNLFKNQSGTNISRYMVGAKQSDDLEGLYIETRKLQWLERSLNTVQLKGGHYFEKLLKLHFDWTGAATSSYQDEPDMRFFTNSFYPGNNEKNQYAIEPSLYKVPARFYRFLKDENYNFKANFTLDFGSANNAPKLKFGGAYLYKKRDFSEKRIDYKFQFPQNIYNGDVSEFLTDENIGLNFPGYNPVTGMNFGLYVQGNPGDDLKNSYTANQQVTAAYAMVDAKLGSKLRLTAGLRYEHTLINSMSKDTTLAVGLLNNNDLLPALNLTFALNEKMNLRFNLSRTIARPTFRELAPYASEDFAGGEIYVGNANLKRTTINNIDLRWEWYSRPGEVFSAGVFYKMFTDPIELVDNPKAQNPELKWDNVARADVYGIEVDFRKKLDFWSFSRHIQLGVNFSYIYSAVDIDSVELSAIRATDPGAASTRPMSEQSPYIINGFVGYNNVKAGIDVNLVYNVTGPKIIINVKGGTPDIYAQPFHSLNFVANKTVGKQFVIGVKIKNLLNDTYAETYTFKRREYIYRQFTLGTTFELSLQYEIH